MVGLGATIFSAFGGPAGALVNNGDGSYLYTFLEELPAGSTETFSVAMEGRRKISFREMLSDQGTSTNGQILFTLDAGPPLERRSVVDEARHLHELGAFTAEELLRLLTLETTRWIFADRRVGRLEEGYEASFLALEANPLDELEALASLV